MKYSFTFQATGTTWQIEAECADADGNMSAENLSTAVKTRVEEFESIYSRFRPNSLVAQIGKVPAASPVLSVPADFHEEKHQRDFTFPEDARELFALYRKMYEATGGLVTPLIGKVISDAGYDATYSLVPKNAKGEGFAGGTGKIQSAQKWDDVMEYNHPVLTIKESAKGPVMLDFGAIGKGYAIDIVGRLLQEKGFENYTVNAGGDILHRAAASSHLRIGLEHPNNPKQAIGVAEISNQSICGSAGNRRAWGEYHHIINPETAISPKHITAVWVVVDAPANGGSADNSTAIADALTTGLFFMDPEMLAQKTGFKFEYLIVYADNTMRRSEHFPAQMF